MSGVRRGRGQHHLGVRRQLDLPCPWSEVRQGHAPYLGIVFRGHDHVEGGGDRSVPPGDLRSVFGEHDLVALRLVSRGLVADRPALAALRVAEVHVHPGLVARDVLTPAGHRDVPPAAVAGSRGGEHHRVTPVGQDVGTDGPVRRGEPPDDGRNEFTHIGHRRHLFRARPGDRDVARRPLLQQQLGRLDDRLAVEARPHGAGVEDVRDGDEQHALVMRHVGAHHRDPGPLRKPGPGVVEGLVETVGAVGAGFPEPAEVLRSRRGIDHGRQSGRVRGDDHILAEAAPEPETRHAEVRVLIGLLEIARIVPRLRDAPGHAALGAVRDLSADHEPAALLQQASRGRAHHERGHQILEHRPRPGHEGGVLLHGGERPPQSEPVRDRRVALRDGHEAREASFRGEQIVAAGIEARVLDAVPDGEELADGVEQEGEVHGRHHRLCVPREHGEAPDHVFGHGHRRAEITHVAVDGRAQGLGPADNLWRRARPIFLGQALRQGGHVAGAGRELPELPGPLGGRARFSRDRRHGVERFLQANPGGRARAPALESARRLADEQRGILDPCESGSSERRVVDLLQAGLLEGDEMSGKIAAVHRRHVPGIEGSAIRGVVPVQEMAAEALETAHRLDGGLEALDGLERPDPAKVVRGHRGQEIEAQVGGRCPVRHHGARVFLEVVRRERVVLGADERGEKAPGPAGNQSERPRICG